MSVAPFEPRIPRSERLQTHGFGDTRERVKRRFLTSDVFKSNRLTALQTGWHITGFFFFQFYGDCILFFIGQKLCIFAFRKMHLESKEKPSKLDAIPSHEGARTFRKLSKVSKRVSINPRFMVLTAGNTVIPIVLWEVTLYTHGITARKTTVLNIGTLVYLALTTSLFLLVHFYSMCNEQCVYWM